MNGRHEAPGLQQLLDQLIARSEKQTEDLRQVRELLPTAEGATAVHSPVGANPDETVWIEASMAATRLGIAKDTVRFLARERGFGKKNGGRWIVDVERIRQHLGLLP